MYFDLYTAAIALILVAGFFVALSALSSKHLRYAHWLAIAFGVLIAIFAGIWSGYLSLSQLDVVKSNNVTLKYIKQSSGSGTGLMIIHGWDSSEGDWADLPNKLAAIELFDEAPVVFVGYKAGLGHEVQSLEKLQGEIDQAVGKLLSNRRWVIVTHSLGGLLARSALATTWKKDQSKKAGHTLLSINCPCAGADIAKLASHLGGSPELLAKIAPDSAYINLLRAKWNEAVKSASLSNHCFVGLDDTVVSYSSGTSGCGSVVELPGVDHSNVLTDPKYREVILRQIVKVLGHLSP